MFVLELNKLKKHRLWWNIIRKNYFGTKKGNKLILSDLEMLYLYENRVSRIKIKKLENLLNKKLEEYLVFKDLIKKGFVVKTALKYGFNFRVYRKKDFGKEHSLYLVQVIKENLNFKAKELIAKFRVAHSVRKRVLFAFIDEEGSIVYYENKWLRI